MISRRPRASNLKEIIGTSENIKQLRSNISIAAPSSFGVSIYGLTGTGKELVAQSIHDQSDRRDGPFVAVNCSAIPDPLFESEFFGFQQGAFTGANRLHRGYFEQAHGGTLFLDEITELQLHFQAKLLRALQEREIVRLGSNTIRSPIPVDVRIIVASNKRLRDEVKAGRFREDLYYRVAIIPITLPPLRDRGRDVLLIANHLLQKLVPVRTLTKEAEQMLLSHDWPGNIRQLKNVLQCAHVFATGKTIDAPQIIRGLTQDTAVETALVTEHDTNRENPETATVSRKEQIQDLLKPRNELSRRAICKELNCSRSSIGEELKELIDAGVVEQIGQGPTVKYRLKSESTSSQEEESGENPPSEPGSFVEEESNENPPSEPGSSVEEESNENPPSEPSSSQAEKSDESPSPKNTSASRESRTQSDEIPQNEENPNNTNSPRSRWSLKVLIQESIHRVLEKLTQVGRAGWNKTKSLFRWLIGQKNIKSDIELINTDYLSSIHQDKHSKSKENVTKKVDEQVVDSDTKFTKMDTKFTKMDEKIHQDDPDFVTKIDDDVIFVTKTADDLDAVTKINTKIHQDDPESVTKIDTKFTKMDEKIHQDDPSSNIEDCKGNQLDDTSDVTTERSPPKNRPQAQVKLLKMLWGQAQMIIAASWDPVTVKEMMRLVGRTDRTYFRRQYLEPLLAAGCLEMTIPDKPQSKYQKYIATPSALNVLEEFYDFSTEY